MRIDMAEHENNMKYYAHSKPDESVETWQPLEEHLANVAKIAAKFAEGTHFDKLYSTFYSLLVSQKEKYYEYALPN